MTTLTTTQSNTVDLHIIVAISKDTLPADLQDCFSLLSLHQKYIYVEKGTDKTLLVRSLYDLNSAGHIIKKFKTIFLHCPKDQHPFTGLSNLADFLFDLKAEKTLVLEDTWDTEITDAIEIRDIMRRWCVLPANKMTPEVWAAEAVQLAGSYGITASSFGRDTITEMGMGAFTAVAKGSSSNPQLIEFVYEVPNAKKVLLVGKGVTFDSGGLSLKKSDRMHEMKFDMIGGAEALALGLLAAKRQLPISLYILVPAAENLPSGDALKPGDVVTSYSGKTIEVINTDAEGRLVLADAISYGIDTFQPDVVIDIATLTSSAVSALGKGITAFFSNSQILTQQLQTASKEAGEEFWQLPLHKPYKDELYSRVADLQNIGHQRSDAIFVALFLEEFVGTVPWLHLDIAGTAWKDGMPTGTTFTTLWKLLQNLTNDTTNR